MHVTTQFQNIEPSRLCYKNEVAPANILYKYVAFLFIIASIKIVVIISVYGQIELWALILSFRLCQSIT